MKPQTIGRRYDVGRIVPIHCAGNDKLNDLDIKDKCFLLAVIYEGVVRFEVGDTVFEAVAPCVLCFDETSSVRLIKKRGVKSDCVYFDPTFLNVNMTFSRIHGGSYEQLALKHDMFLLKPFTDKERYGLPLFDGSADNFKRLFTLMEKELKEQNDWYWSCRSRSYFMEMLLLLERIYGLIKQSDLSGDSRRINNPHLKKAVIYIENNYHNSVSLKDIVEHVSLNHATLTKLFKNELSMTPIDYLWQYRLTVAKKFLEFTSLPIKDIALRCGFKTTQHFSRKFEENAGSNPSTFRTDAVEKRKNNFSSFVQKSDDNKSL